ncbi:MAG: hypothetical protein U0835_05330 [Isosphaeraceae bacterium]
MALAAVSGDVRDSGLTLDGPVRRLLGRVDRRLRLRAGLSGGGVAALIASATALAGMAVDVAWPLPTAVRWAVWAVWVALAGGLGLRTIGRILAGGAGRRVALAALVEKAEPSLGERLTGAVGLIEGMQAGKTAGMGSPVLVAALVDEVSGRVGTVEPSRVVPLGRAWGWFLAGALAVLAAAGPALVRPDPFASVALRFLMPWVSVDRVGLFEVSVSPGDVVMAVGDDLAVSATVAARFGHGLAATPPTGAWLEWTETATGQTRRLAMSAANTANGRTFQAVVPSLTGPVRYRVVADDTASRSFGVRAVEPPRIAELSVLVQPPAYTQLPQNPARNPARVEAWEDSRVTLTVRTDRPVRSVEVDWPRAKRTQFSDPASESSGVAGVPSSEPRNEMGPATVFPLAPNEANGRRRPGPQLPGFRRRNPPPPPEREVRTETVPARVAAEGTSATLILPAEVAGEFSVRLRDADGIVSRAEPPRRLIVQADGPPTVEVRGVDGLDEAKADDTLRFGVSARDDVAVAVAELHYTIERSGSAAQAEEMEKPGKIILTLNGLGSPQAQGTALLRLGPLGLRPGDAVVYRVRVADNRPAPRGPNEAWSEPRRLGIVANAAPLLARRGQADREAIQRKLDALKKAAAENRQEAEQLRYAADAVARGNGNWDRERAEALSSREAAAREVADRHPLLALALDDDPAVGPLARPARPVAEVEAEAARAALDPARQDDEAANRLADLRLADTRLGAVSTRLEELQRQLDQLARSEAARQRLQALADRQAEVADRAEAAAEKADPHAPPDRAPVDRLDADQNAVRKDLDALLREAPELKAGLLQAQAADADALAKRARELAARQREEARKATDLTPQAAALKALADEQRALEDEARRLALDVDQPLAEAGRGRLNVDPIRQAAAPIERADLELGRQRLAQAENELRRLARDLDEAPGDLKALARRLSQTQAKLAGDLAQALGEHRGRAEVPADERAAVAARVAPLVARQKAVAELAAAVEQAPQAKDLSVKPRFPVEAAQAARAAASRALEALAGPNPVQPKEAERLSGEARNALGRLANELPDPGRRDDPARRAANESRQALHDALREVERHLRETEPILFRDPARAAAELSNRLANAGDRARAAADRLETADVRFPERLAPQRARAASRARALAEAVDRARAVPKGPAPFDPETARLARDGLDAAALDARAGFDRLDQKFNGQVPADDLAEELAGEQTALKQAGTTAPAAERARDQRRLATALRGLRGQTPDAALALDEAVRRTDQAARVLETDGPNAPPAQAEAVARAEAAVEALARRLNDRQSPRDRAEVLARAERGLNEPDADADPAAMVKLQRNAAAELDRLARATPDAKVDAASKAAAEAAVREALGLTDLAAKPPKPGAVVAEAPPAPADLARARTRAAEAIEALAAKLPAGPDTPVREQVKEPAGAVRDPDLAVTPEHAARAGELARQERRLRERLQSVLAGRVEPQRDLRRESAALGQELAELRDRAREISPRASGPANESAALLREHAPRAMDAAAEQLAQGQPAPARDAQRRAAELAERGAQAVDDLAAALRADVPPNAEPEDKANDDPDAKHRTQPNPLAKAREAMSNAARDLQQARNQEPGGKGEPGKNPGSRSEGAFKSARQAMRDAADGLQSAAEARPNPGAGRQTKPQTADARPASQAGESTAQDPKGGRIGTARAQLSEIQDLVRQKAGRAWGELPGHLRTEILQSTQARYRDDYARLIQMYFREIAAGAGAGKGDGPPGTPKDPGR